MSKAMRSAVGAMVAGAVLAVGSLGVGVWIGVRVGTLDASGAQREVVCDNVTFHEFDAYAAVQARCNGGVLVTLLD